MELLYIGTFMFRQEGEKLYGLPSCADHFFQKYLDVFDTVRVLGDPVRSFLETSALVEMTDSRISVLITKSNKSPLEFRNDKDIRKMLREEISKAQSVLIKPATRKGMMAIQICKEFNVPYMIEMTGDIHNALRQHPSLLKRLYAPVYYRQILNSIKDCKFGLYVSESYLQEQFPIEGLMCGCSDVILEKADPRVLQIRYERIDSMDTKNRVDIALIGFYQGKMKGVDTAIRALSKLPDSYHLNILGNGTEENRRKWIEYGLALGVKDRIHFPKPLPNATEVLNWLDTQDFLILPTLSEGLCRCLVEAISRGCVCFATNICSMPELLTDDCLHPIKDDKKLAKLLLNASENKEWMKHMAKRNFEHSKNYEFEKLRQKRIEFLKKFETYCKSFQ